MRYVLPAAAVVLLLSAPAWAEVNTGVYVEGQVGYSFPESVDAGVGGIDGDIDLEEAPVFGGAIGYRFTYARLELNGSYRKYDVDKVHAEGLRSGGDGEATSVVGLVNLFIDPDLGLPVHPFVGGGVGAAYVEVDTGNDSPLEVDDEAGAFAWNLSAGLTWDITPSVALSASYRYLRLAGTDFSADLAGIDIGDVDVDDVVSHEVLLGLRYTF
ncbi:outer membrane protein [Benzoatithermus flavus]|uniref:Outer membrane beta-barrel protein n=1 Tax=Benzoatithermus flavus TaxID=3108223 RepID=A0ABU8XSH6_9PROT